MQAVDDLLYIPTFTGLGIINVSDPLYPEILVAHDLCSVSEVIIQDNIAYLSCGYDGLKILNVTDPIAATSISNYTPVDIATRGLEVKGDIAYIGEQHGFHIVNLTDIYNPTQIVYVPDLTGGYEIIAEDNLLVYHSVEGAMLYDVSTPSPVSIFNFSVTFLSAIIHSNTLFLTGGHLYAFDITDPENPVELLDHQSLDGGVYRDFVLSDGYIYLTGSTHYIEIYRYDDTEYWNDYVSFAVIQTDLIYTCDDDANIVKATLHVDYSTPTNTAIHYFVSARDGFFWTEISPGTETSLSLSGRNLKWRAELSSSDVSVTPTISSLNITCTAILVQPMITSPSPGEILDDNTPEFSWAFIESAESYILQVDTTSDFDSSNRISVSIPMSVAPSYQVTESMSEGDWFWRVAGVDSEGDFGEFSQPCPFTIDALTDTGTDTGTPPDDITLLLLLGGAGIAVVAIVVMISKRGK